jgi:hypothetical protein
MLLRIIPNDYSYKKRQLLSKAKNIESLILGSSHTLYGINPEYFSPSSFNLAHVSQSLNYDLKLLKKYGDKIDNLKMVIIHISYFTLFSNLDYSGESWRVKNYSIYYHVGVPLKPYNYFELLNGNISTNFTRLSEWLCNKNDIPIIRVSEFGFDTGFGSEIKNNLKETGEAASRRHTTDDTYLNYNRKIIEDIIRYCDSRKLKLIFITLPAYYTYRNNLKSSQLNETINYISTIANTYDFISYYNHLSITLFQKKIFMMRII